MEPEKRKAASKKIREWVFANKRYKAADTVFVYASYKSEVETKEIIQGALRQGKRVALPKVHGTKIFFYEIQSWEDLFPGYQGILEPQNTNKEPLVPSGKHFPEAVPLQGPGTPAQIYLHYRGSHPPRPQPAGSSARWWFLR